MMQFWAPLALTVATAAMLAVPLAPALLEVRHRRDAAPLPIQQHDGEVTNFAQSFQNYVRPLLAMVVQCDPREAPRTVKLADGGQAILSRHKGTHQLTPDMHGGRVSALVVCANRVVLGDGMVFSNDFYAADAVFGGSENVFRALLGEGDVFLGEDSRILRWLHAEGSVYLGRGCEADGRLSAARAVYLWPGCTFERVHAPRIATVWGDTIFPAGRAAVVQPGSRLDDPMRRWRVVGDFQLRRGEELEGNLVGQSEIRIGDGCRVQGAVKSHGNTLIGGEAEIDGSVVSSGDVHLADACFVRGPVLAEGEIVIAAGSQIGTAEMPTTVSAARIFMAPGVLVHGTLWARELGQVGR